MARIPTAPVVAGSLVAGYLVARETGIRPLGGAVLAAGGVWADPVVGPFERAGHRRCPARHLPARLRRLAPAGQEDRRVAGGAHRRRRLRPARPGSSPTAAPDPRTPPHPPPILRRSRSASGADLRRVGPAGSVLSGSAARCRRPARSSTTAVATIQASPKARPSRWNSPCAGPGNVASRQTAAPTPPPATRSRPPCDRGAAARPSPAPARGPGSRSRGWRTRRAGRRCPDPTAPQPRRGSPAPVTTSAIHARPGSAARSPSQP